jgi:hypothetical protein
MPLEKLVHLAKDRGVLARDGRHWRDVRPKAALSCEYQRREGGMGWDGRTSLKWTTACAQNSERLARAGAQAHTCARTSAWARRAYHRTHSCAQWPLRSIGARWALQCKLGKEELIALLHDRGHVLPRAVTPTPPVPHDFISAQTRPCGINNSDTARLHRRVRSSHSTAPPDCRSARSSVS